MPDSSSLPGGNQDDERNIGQQHADNVVNPLLKYEKDGNIDTAQYNQDDHAEYTRQREAEAAQGAPGSWANKTSSQGEPKSRAGKVWTTLTGKKKGAIGGIIVILLGLMGIGGTLFTPGLGIVQMKEILTSNLNDQLAAMDIRGDAVFYSKLKSISSGVCTGVQIKCKFSTMSKKQVTKFQTAFEKYGYTIPADGIEDTKLGRQRIVKIVAPDGAEIKNPADLVAARKTNPDIRAAMKRAFNPVYYGLSDKVANAFLEKNRTNKQKKITGTDEEEQKKQLTEATSGERAGGGRGVVLTDADGEYVIDEDGQRVDSEDPGYQSAKAGAEARAAEFQGTSKPDAKAFTSGLKVGVGALSALGVGDAACSVYGLARAVSATAKVARSMQLVQFAMVVNTTADSIKAGDATPEEVEFIANKATATDTRQLIYDEVTGQNIENPMYGKSAFDSAGYKTAAYNDAPTLNAAAQQYMIGGGMSGTLSSVTDSIANIVSPGAPERIGEVCGVIQSPWVRGIGLVAGVALAIGSFGVGTVAMGAASLAVSFAMPFLAATLADIVAGNVIGGDIAGTDFGNAYFAGSGALLGGVAQARGMQPLSQEGIQEYIAATSDTQSALIADEKREASKDQWNIYNQYSFVGSIARSLYPSSVQAKSSVAGAVLSIGSILNQGVASLTNNASAAQAYNAERFSKCLDTGYAELGLDADIFCNLRYGLTAQELAMDNQEVVDFMIDSGYINSTGNPQGEYADFMKYCANRENGWGETGEESTDPNAESGRKCIDGTGVTYAHISYFRVYTMDYSISEAMDDEQQASAQMTGTGEFVLPLEPGYGMSSTWGPRSCSGCSTYHKAVDLTNYPGGSSGKPVFAIGDGEVITATMGNPSCTGGMGGAPYGANNPVHIRHTNGLISVYLHMPANSVSVKVGDQVTAGQQIGVIGNCGQSFGAHLHFETMVDDGTDAQFKDIGGGDAYGQWRNPLVVMPMLGIDIANGSYTDGR